VDYCYRQNSIVCLLFGRSVTILSRAKTAELIEMSFEVQIRVDPRNLVLDGVQVSTCEGGILRGKTLSEWQMAGWKSNINNFSITESELWINTGPSTFQLQETMLKSDKVWCTYLVANCQFTNFLNAPCILCVYSLNLNLAHDQRMCAYRSPLNWKFGQMMRYCGGVLPRRGDSINDQGEIWRGRLYCENNLALQI